MTTPLMALAVGVIVVGFIGIPQALGGTNALEQFLAPVFSATGQVPVTEGGGPHLPRGVQLGLLFVSVLIAGAGILTARHFYITRPELPRALAAKWPGLHALLVNKYYVDELYHSTVVRGTLAGARLLWSADRRIVDGGVHAAAALTHIGAWLSHMLDKHVVDGVVNLTVWSAAHGSFGIRRFQTGLVQNYALLMVAGVVMFLTVYLLAS
jgi:NADH-quinone oxidoreductase subunit L